VGWKQFSNLPITFANPALNSTLIEGYNNSSAIRLGAEYTIPTDGWKLRAGFVGVASAAPPETVTPLLPEQDRNYWTLGAGVPFMSRWTVDASFAHVSTPGARGRIVQRTTTTNTNLTADQLNTGVFDLSANVFSITLKAGF
jgi:long-chain fatty acid transport protein